MKNEETKSSGGASEKINKLKKQYNGVLKDLFVQFAPECIETALGEVEGSFGENIQGVIAKALENLKGKVMSELGMESEGGVTSGEEIAPMGDEGGMGISVLKIGDDTLDAESEENEADLGKEEKKEHEESETKEEEKEEKEEKPEEEEEEKEEKVEEKYLHDQVKLTRLYESMYRK